jgi:hypothetical protein
VSSHGCTGFSELRPVSGIRFPLQQWPGDFLGATIAGPDVVVAWPVAGGDDRGIHVSVGRGLAAS